MTHKTEGLTNCYSHDLLIIDIVVGAIFVNGRRVFKDRPGPSIYSAKTMVGCSPADIGNADHLLC